MRRRGVPIILTAGCLTALTLFACGDDDTAVTPSSDGGPSEGGATTDARDSATVDVANDTGTQPDSGDAGDAGPTISSSLGSTGVIRVNPDAIFAEFREDDTIIRASDAPDCVGWVFSSTKPFSEAGKITVGGAIVGSDGGTPTPIEINPMQDPSGFTYFYLGPVHDPAEQLVVEVQKAGTVTFPPMAVQTVRTPPAAVVQVSKPVAPDGGELVVPIAQGLDIEWTVPSGAHADHRFFVMADLFNTNGPKKGALRCSYPLAQTKAKLPTSLLSDMKTILGTSMAGGLIVAAGGRKEVTIGGATYVIETSRYGGVSLADGVPIRFQ